MLNCELIYLSDASSSSTPALKRSAVPSGKSSGPCKSKQAKIDPVDEALLKALQNQENVNENDEDRLFCLSLVPKFKRLTPVQRDEGQLAVLQVLSRIANPQLSHIQPLTPLQPSINCQPQAPLQPSVNCQSQANYLNYTQL